MRQPTCRVLVGERTWEEFNDGDAPHTDGAPLCEAHVSKCQSCAFVICTEHEQCGPCRTDFTVSRCTACNGECCDMHRLQCVDCEQYECVKCAPHGPIAESTDWNLSHHGEYRCEQHRQAYNADSSPSSPVAESRTKRAKRKLSTGASQ